MFHDIKKGSSIKNITFWNLVYSDCFRWIMHPNSINSQITKCKTLKISSHLYCVIPFKDFADRLILTPRIKLPDSKYNYQITPKILLVRVKRVVNDYLSSEEWILCFTLSDWNLACANLYFQITFQHCTNILTLILISCFPKSSVNAGNNLSDISAIQIFDNLQKIPKIEFKGVLISFQEKKGIKKRNLCMRNFLKPLTL